MKTKRINLTMSPDEKEQVDRLMRVARCATYTQFFQNAVSTYEELLLAAYDGAEVVLHYPDGTTQKVRFPGQPLQAAKVKRLEEQLAMHESPAANHDGRSSSVG